MQQPTLIFFHFMPAPPPRAQVNIIVVFEEGYMVTENHAIRLYRA